MDLLGLLRRGHLAGADRPDRLVGDDDAVAASSLPTPSSARSVWVWTTLSVVPGLALGQGLADAEDRPQLVLERRQDLEIDEGVGLAK
jgi:hypothetical protein